MTVEITTREFSFEGADSESDDDEDSTGVQTVEMDAGLSFTASRTSEDTPDLDGFNDYGVREVRNDETGDLQAVDVLYEAMQPGPPEERNGVRITEQFLQNVASKDYDESEPYMLGHSDKPLDEIGKVQSVWFSESAKKLMVMNRVFNTGAQTHDEVINRLTHKPPTMTDGSVGLGNNYEAAVNAAGEPELIDGRIREFSSVPFPGGYEEGGVGLPSTAFAEQVLDKVEGDFDDGDVSETPENSVSAVTTTISF